jgi:hypothetical protein
MNPLIQQMLRRLFKTQGTKILTRLAVRMAAGLGAAGAAGAASGAGAAGATAATAASAATGAAAAGTAAGSASTMVSGKKVLLGSFF